MSLNTITRIIIECIDFIVISLSCQHCDNPPFFSQLTSVALFACEHDVEERRAPQQLPESRVDDRVQGGEGGGDQGAVGADVVETEHKTEAGDQGQQPKGNVDTLRKLGTVKYRNCLTKRD